LALVVCVLVAVFAARAMGAPDPRELKAREDFAGGRYQEALDLFARLYAESLHPNYLRNIGRCYQNLGQPDRAINSFRDYLHKAKDLSPDEHQEIEGYIKEMEDLKSQRAGTPGAADHPTGSAAPVVPLPASGNPGSEAAAPEAIVSAPAPAPQPTEGPPVYERWWCWALIGGAVAIGIGAAAAAGVFTKTQDASCPGGVNCQ
jgi:tetratricopeptide (TPR) repeat protein